MQATQPDDVTFVTPPQPSAKALGKRRMCDVVASPTVTQEEASILAELACAACPPPAADSPPCVRPIPDCSGDEVLAAMLQAEADAEASEMRRLQREQQTGESMTDQEEEVEWRELFGDADEGIEGDFGHMDLDRVKHKCDAYQRQADFINRMCDDLEASKRAGNVIEEGYGYDDEVLPVELTEDVLDMPPLVAVGVPVISPYFQGMNPYEPLNPSPAKVSAKRYKGSIKIDPDDEVDYDDADALFDAPESASCSQEAM